MRFFRLSYIAAGSIGLGSAFFFDLPLGAAGCSWRAEADGGVGAGPVGGGLAVRGGAIEVVAVVVVVTVPFMADAGRRRREEIREGDLNFEEPGLVCGGVGSATREFGTRWHGNSDLILLPLFIHSFILVSIQYTNSTILCYECKDCAEASSFLTCRTTAVLPVLS